MNKYLRGVSNLRERLPLEECYALLRPLTRRSSIAGKLGHWLVWHLMYSPAERRHAAVGPPRLWKVQRDFQIQFLRRVGLKPQHYLLDLGCGTLRGGIPIIAHLEKGHYFGLEVRAEVVDEARKELQAAGLVHKNPTLMVIREMASLNLERKFDYIWSFAVLPHMRDGVLRDAVGFVRRHLGEGGTFYATANIGNAPERDWQDGFPSLTRSFESYKEVCSSGGLRIEDLGPLTDLGHPLPKTGRQLARQHMLKIWKA
ncbi:MAG TPA: class I SAM-dependent methyltransferase [Candidatus Eisenbacteria bacterium]|nr:class I SAM-dependent methyltransferase [Candidatus Eisenbacteria bacterium]